MAYRFKLDENIEKGFRRIAREQIDRALAELSPLEIGASGVHESRKALKRLRALLRLVAPAIGQKSATQRNSALRSIAHLLAARRDEAVLLATIGRLEADADTDGKAAFAEFRLELGRQKADPVLALDGETAQHARLLLVKEAKRLSKITFKLRGFDALMPGLHESYRAGRRALKLAYQKPSDEGFHDLRKTVQWHWRQMSLLSRAWPAAFDARIAAARELSQMLGDDHDLAMLALTTKTTTSLSEQTIAVVELACRSKQRILREAADFRLQRLFAETPGAFGCRMEAYWRAGRHIAPVAAQKSAELLVDASASNPPLSSARPGQASPVAAKMPVTAPSQRRA